MTSRVIGLLVLFAAISACSAHGAHGHEDPPATDGTAAAPAPDPHNWSKYGWDGVTIVHAFCMCTAFLVLMPIGVVLAAMGSKLHKWVQILATVVAAFGFVVMFLSHGFFEHFQSIHSHMGLVTLGLVSVQVVYGFIAKFKFSWSVALTETARREAEQGSPIPCRVCCLQWVNFPKVHSRLALAILGMGFATCFWGWFGGALAMCVGDSFEYDLVSNCKSHFVFLAIVYLIAVLYIGVLSGTIKVKRPIFFYENLAQMISGAIIVFIKWAQDIANHREMGYVFFCSGVMGLAMYFTAPRKSWVDTVGISLVCLGFFFTNHHQHSEFAFNMHVAFGALLGMVGVLKVFTKFETHGNLWAFGLIVTGTEFACSGTEVTTRAEVLYGSMHLMFIVWIVSVSMMVFAWWFAIFNLYAKYKFNTGDDGEVNEEDVLHANGMTQGQRAKFSILHASDGEEMDEAI